MHQSDDYQWKLRAVGAFLDTQRASRISAIETRTGYALRYYQEGQGSEPVFVIVEQAQLRAITEALRQRRIPVPGEGDIALGGPLSQQGKYQDFFRALGWELDDLGAGSVLLDEQEETGVFVTYAYRDPTNPQFWRKRIANLGAIEQQQILTEARARRRLH